MGVKKRGNGDITKRYRPRRLTEIAGNEGIVQSLIKSIDQGDDRAKTYLFTGEPGTGKTTSARILAMGLNCETGDTGEPCLECQACKDALNGNSLHITELNGAKYGNKGDAFELSEAMNATALTGRNKIYILDEIHKLNKAAQDLLLKPLEEPPPNTYIFLCTSNPKKINKAMKNRCEIYDFKLPTKTTIVGILKDVFAQQDGWSNRMSDSDKVKFLDAVQGFSCRGVLKAIDKVVRGGLEVLTPIDEEDPELFKIVQLVNAGKFDEVMNAIKKLDGAFDCEGFRLLAVSFFNSVLVRAGMKDMRTAAIACDMMECFLEPYYDANPKPRMNRDIFKACVSAHKK